VRDPVNGKMECPKDYILLEKCGDGLAPGAEREALPIVCTDTNKPPTCEDTGDETIKEGDDIGKCSSSKALPTKCKGGEAPTDVAKPACTSDGTKFEVP